MAKIDYIPRMRSAHSSIQKQATDAVLRSYGLDKTAAGLLGAALFGLGGHLGVNTLGTKAHHYTNLGEVLAHRGFQHGLLNQAMPSTRLQTLKAIFGPESVVSYEQARNLAAKVVENAPHPDMRRTALQLAHSKAAPLHGTPVLGDIAKAIGHELHETAPSLESSSRIGGAYAKAVEWLARPTMTGFETGAQRAVKNLAGAVPAAALFAADPGGVPGHFAVNVGRQLVADSALGKKFVEQELNKGLSGQALSKGRKAVLQHIVSPAITDAREIGLHARQHGVTPEHLNLAAKALERFK